MLKKFNIFHYHPFMVPLITIGILLVLSGVAYGLVRFKDRNLSASPDSRIVVISYDGQKQIVPSTQTTVGKLLNKLSVPLNDGDRVEPSLNTQIDQDQFRVNIYRALPIEIIDGNKKTFAFTAATTPRSIAAASGTSIYAEDELVAEPTDSFLKDGALGQRVIIDRATPIQLDLYGTTVAIRTQGETVRDVVKEKGIKLDKGDKLAPGAGTKITAGMQLRIIRNGVKISTVDEVIPMEVETIHDNSLSYGTTAVRQKGSPGKRIVTYEDVLQNNVIVSRKVLQEIVQVKPVKQIEVMGTNLTGIKNNMSVAGIPPSEYAAADYIISKESGWNPAAENASSGAYGLCQSLPGIKMASVAPDWRTNPVTQLKWCNNYAKKYGGWNGAKAFWDAHHWW